MATIHISNAYLSATIQHQGAELVSLKNKEGKEYLWNGNPQYWGKHSPILFPIVGTLKNNQYEYEGTIYQLPRHGFARDLSFTIMEQSSTSVTLALESNTDTLKLFPFEFELQLSYSLVENTLVLGYKVINKNKTILPFSIGGHPAFALSLPFEKYQLEFDTASTLTYHLLDEGLISNQTEQLSLDNGKLRLHYQLFENDALVFKNIPSKAVTILEENQPILKVDYTDFPDLGVWTPVNAPFICIEPWFGYADTPNNSGKLMEKEGIQRLAPEAVFQSNYTITIL